MALVICSKDLFLIRVLTNPGLFYWPFAACRLATILVHTSKLGRLVVAIFDRNH